MHRFFNGIRGQESLSTRSTKDVWSPVVIFSLMVIVAKTFFHACRQFFRDEAGKIQVKQEWANDVLSFLGFTVEVSGNNPSQKTCVLVGNHVGFLDIPVLLSVFPSAVFIAKEDLRWWPVLGQCIASAGTIFISRKKNADRSHSRLRIKELLEGNSGLSVATFPSGTTCLDESLPWKKGIFEIAQEANTPVQVFKIRYEPLRESAYIDDDSFIVQLSRLMKVRNKRILFTWLDSYSEVTDPAQFAESLRERVAAHA